MRTSDEKRREIAAELRAESERWHYYREDDNVFCMSDHEFAEVILDDFGFNDMDMPAYEVFGQMADIIDPTCHIVLRPSDSALATSRSTSARGAAKFMEGCRKRNEQGRLEP